MSHERVITPSVFFRHLLLPLHANDVVHTHRSTHPSSTHPLLCQLGRNECGWVRLLFSNHHVLVLLTFRNRSRVSESVKGSMMFVFLFYGSSAMERRGDQVTLIDHRVQ